MTLPVSSVSLPPFGIASRALTARLSSAVVSCAGSATACQASSSSIASISICSPSVGRSRFAVSRDQRVDVDRARLAAAGVARRRAAAASARRRASRPRRSSGRSRRAAAGRRTPSARISIVPVMTVRMLLKSCATPPVSWPTASIFCDWRSCASAGDLVGQVADECVEHVAAQAAQRRDGDLDPELAAVAPAPLRSRSACPGLRPRRCRGSVRAPPRDARGGPAARSWWRATARSPRRATSRTSPRPDGSTP